MTDTFDTIVIGAGLNGLTTAAYLAKAGWRVLVLERRGEVGGTAITQEVFRGFRFNVAAHDAGWLNPAIVKDLNLAQYGLAMIQPDAVVFTPGGLTLWRDLTKSVEAIGKLSKSDAGKWPAFSARMAKLAGFLKAAYTVAIPNITTTDLSDLFMAAGLGRRLRGLGQRDMMEMVRWLPMPVDVLLDDWFESDALKGAIGAGGITNLMQGPRASGTAFVMLHHHVGQAAGRSMVRGGVGNLANALSAAAQAFGAQIRLNAEVARIVVKEDRAAGVVLASSEEIAARRVVSAVDPRRTFFNLIDPMHLEPTFVRAVQNIKYRAVRAKINLALSGLPGFSGADEIALRGVISISPSLDYLERAYDDAKYGEMSQKPYLEATIPSLSDPALAPEGRHVMSIWMQYAPYRLKEGAWDDAKREALGDLVVNTLAEHAPNLQSLILHRQVLTPVDLETTFGLTEGHLYHGELTLDQLLFMRPVAGWAQYRTPIAGVYLCGAGTHPGGGLAGAAGFNAAREILKDARRRA